MTLYIARATDSSGLKITWTNLAAGARSVEYNGVMQMQTKEVLVFRQMLREERTEARTDRWLYAIVV